MTRRSITPIIPTPRTHNTLNQTRASGLLGQVNKFPNTLSSTCSLIIVAPDHEVLDRDGTNMPNELGGHQRVKPGVNNRHPCWLIQDIRSEDEAAALSKTCGTRIRGRVWPVNQHPARKRREHVQGLGFEITQRLITHRLAVNRREHASQLFALIEREHRVTASEQFEWPQQLLCGWGSRHGSPFHCSFCCSPASSGHRGQKFVGSRCCRDARTPVKCSARECGDRVRKAGCGGEVITPEQAREQRAVKHVSGPHCRDRLHVERADKPRLIVFEYPGAGGTRRCNDQFAARSSRRPQLLADTVPGE